MKKATIIIADNDNAMCSILSHAVRQRGYNVITTDNYTSLIKWVQSGKGDVVVTDLMMPGGNGLDTLSQIKKIHSNLPVIVISGQNTLMAAVRANELGAFDFMAKPFDIEVLLNCVEKALYTEIANAEMQQCDVAEDTQENLPLIGSCQAMQEIYKTVARLVPVDLSVMINGESGTGKELIARAIHGLGKRKEYPFVAVNMAAIPKELVESELFGHEKGAFTGAQNRKAGKFEQAEGGTLFLDEIGDMPADAQTKLLRVLQQGEFTPVGSNKSIKANVRIICATHRSLDEMIQ
jgi:two-component system nitrogen regulation response regulator GlnG